MILNIRSKSLNLMKFLTELNVIFLKFGLSDFILLGLYFYKRFDFLLFIQVDSQFQELDLYFDELRADKSTLCTFQTLVVINF